MYQNLMAPIQFRGVTLRNRILVPPHGNGLATYEHLPSERQMYYFAEKSKGGVGCIIWGGSTVLLNSVGLPGRNFIGDERSIPGYQKATAMVHEYGAKIFAQLSHQGRQQTSKISRQALWAPTAIPCSLNRETPKEMEPEDFETLMAAYAKSARNAMDGGFDGVEVYGAHGYLLSQFLSPHTNWRTDEYGGTFEGRLKLWVDVLRTVRQTIGESVPMGLRMNGDDFTAGGLSVDDMCRVAQALEATGLVDYFSISGGNYLNLPVWIAEMSYPPGMLVPLASAIRRSISLPVVAVNRITDPMQADKIIADGHADMVGMVRALICDPEFPNKAAAGRAEDIRPCISCNQGCMGRAFRGLPIGCIHNASVGYEADYGAGKVAKVSAEKRVVVIGGGPAGLEAATVAAERGCTVTLFEKSDRLGGQVNYITKIASRGNFANIVEYRARQMRKLGVEVHLGRAVTADEVVAMGADAVIVATGSTPARTGYTPLLPNRREMPGADQPHVLTSWDALDESKPVGDRVIVVDEESDWPAVMVAEHLGVQGKQVTLVTRHLFAGQELDGTTMGPQYQRLVKAGVKLAPMIQIDRIEGSKAIGFNVFTKEEQIFEVDNVVLVMGNTANDSLYHQLKGRVSELHRVGDCVAPRRIIDAVFDASRAASAL